MSESERIIRSAINKFNILSKNRKDFYGMIIEVCKKHYDFLGVSIIENDDETSLKLEFLLNKFIIKQKLIKDSDYKLLLSFNTVVPEKNYENHIDVGNNIIIDVEGNIIIKGKKDELASHIDERNSPFPIITMWLCNFLNSIKSE